jgi:hypothetical protein
VLWKNELGGRKLGIKTFSYKRLFSGASNAKGGKLRLIVVGSLSLPGSFRLTPQDGKLTVKIQSACLEWELFASTVVALRRSCLMISSFANGLYAPANICELYGNERSIQDVSHATAYRTPISLPVATVGGKLSRFSSGNIPL